MLTPLSFVSFPNSFFITTSILYSPSAFGALMLPVYFPEDLSSVRAVRVSLIIKLRLVRPLVASTVTQIFDSGVYSV
jgi:hypothetical protein